MKNCIKAIMMATTLLSISEVLVAQTELIIGSTEEGDREFRSFNREVFQGADIRDLESFNPGLQSGYFHGNYTVSRMQFSEDFEVLSLDSWSTQVSYGGFAFTGSGDLFAGPSMVDLDPNDGMPAEPVFSELAVDDTGLPTGLSGRIIRGVESFDHGARTIVPTNSYNDRVFFLDTTLGSGVVSFVDLAALTTELSPLPIASLPVDTPEINRIHIDQETGLGFLYPRDDRQNILVIDAGDAASPKYLFTMNLPLPAVESILIPDSDLVLILTKDQGDEYVLYSGNIEDSETFQSSLTILGRDEFVEEPSAMIWLEDIESVVFSGKRQVSSYVAVDYLDVYHIDREGSKVSKDPYPIAISAGEHENPFLYDNNGVVNSVFLGSNDKYIPFRWNPNLPSSQDTILGNTFSIPFAFDQYLKSIRFRSNVAGVPIQFAIYKSSSSLSRTTTKLWESSLLTTTNGVMEIPITTPEGDISTFRNSSVFVCYFVPDGTVVGELVNVQDESEHFSAYSVNNEDSFSFPEGGFDYGFTENDCLWSMSLVVRNENPITPTPIPTPTSPPIDDLLYYIEGENGDMVVEVRDAEYSYLDWKVLLTNVTKSETLELGPFERGVSQSIPVLHGDVYTLQYQLRDLEGNWTQLSEPSNEILANRPPVISNRRFEPESPTTYDDITFLYDISDPDGDNITTTVNWVQFAGPRPQPFPGHEGATLPATLTYGKGWYQAYVNYEDEYGETGTFFFPNIHEVIVQNTLPSQPIVEILPRQPDPSQDLIVNVLTYSVDPDGDEVAYDFRWFESTDGGTTWVAKVELNGSPQVSNLFIDEGDLWRVEYTPYEVTSRSGERILGRRNDGTAGRDQIFVGDNNLPELTITKAGLSGESTIDVKWSYRDADHEDGTLNLYWSDFQGRNLNPIATNLDASVGQGLFNINLPANDIDVYLYAVVYDQKSAATQVIIGPLEQIVTSASETIWILN